MLISSQQTGFIANRCISESGISDLLDVTEEFKTNSYLVAIDIEKAFNSLDNNFLLTTLGKFSIGTKEVLYLRWNERHLRVCFETLMTLLQT